jgi:hypothetical protein
MDKFWFGMIVLFLFFAGLFAWAIWENGQKDQKALEWCEAHGYKKFEIEGARLCWEPDTNLVYRPII